MWFTSDSMSSHVYQPQKAQKAQERMLLSVPFVLFCGLTLMLFVA
jgi:hypothetical protein